MSVSISTFHRNDAISYLQDESNTVYTDNINRFMVKKNDSDQSLSIEFFLQNMSSNATYNLQFNSNTASDVPGGVF